MNEQDQPRDPFIDFINQALDLDGIDGLDPLAVGMKMRQILHELPSNITPDLWNQQLDGLQAAIRLCLDLNLITSVCDDTMLTESVNRDDLETLIMLSVTFAFVSYNRLHAAHNIEEQYAANASLLACRLRDHLQAATGWVKKAAQNGDSVAEKFLEETESLLATSRHLE